MFVKEVSKHIAYTLYIKIGKKPMIYDRLKTSKMLKENDALSIVRFGDGELEMIIAHHNLGFQKYDSHLAKRLEMIIKKEKSDESILICLPNCFSGTSRLNKKPALFWESWVLKYRKEMSKLWNKDCYYGDTNVTRLYLSWKDRSHEQEIIENIRSTWEMKEIIIVEGEKSKFGVGNNLFENAKSVKRILCPAENSWDKYNEILSYCKKQEKDTMFILALGPTATILACDLSNLGYRALDLGHMDLQYEYLLRSVSEKVIIPGKYNNEVAGGNIVSSSFDEEYEKSIIYRIG